MTHRTALTIAPAGPTTPVSRTWRWSNVALPEAHIGLMSIGVLAHVLRPWHIASRPSLRRVGWTLIIGGLALAGWATREAGDIDLERPDRVATSGPYSFSRNPMYVAWTLMFVGVGLVVRTAWLMVLLPVLAALTDREVRTEEDRLTAALGVEYQAYRAAVRRYL
jgi:protein-S-isoprenylcysteine O-methyltransferase Ste14